MPRKSMKFHLIFCGILAIGFVFLQKTIAIAQKNYMGYCFEESNFLTDDGILNKAVHEALESYPPMLEFKDSNGLEREFYTPERPIIYMGLNQFLELNKNCCKRLRRRNVDEGEPQGLVRWLGLVNGFYEMKYKVRYINEGGEFIEVMHHENLPISNCGRRIHWWKAEETGSIEILYRFYKEWSKK